jgi:hypothetical protein
MRDNRPDILGSVIGGFLEYVSMTAGFRLLLLVALAPYAAYYMSYRCGGRPKRRSAGMTQSPDDARIAAATPQEHHRDFSGRAWPLP